MESKNILTQILLEPKEAYKAPFIEVVDVRVERGFQASGDEDGDGVDDDKGDPTY